MALLEIRDLHLTFATPRGPAQVLNGVDLRIEQGEIWGLVGETGCGKSLTGLSVTRLVSAPSARYGRGTIRFRGQDILHADDRSVRALRGREIGMIFQDPTTNLNPVFRIGSQLTDVALQAGRRDPALIGLAAGASRRAFRAAARRHALELLRRVGIVDAARRFDDFPHQFSGGMRQRVLIAMALAARPSLLIADEPTTALDVSVQAQILGLLYALARETGSAVILITHNLGIVAQICSHVAVMYAGSIIESGEVRSVLKRPAHPYTQALLDAMPRPHLAKATLRSLPGHLPDLNAPLPGCRFAPRCALAMAVCHEGMPDFTPVGTDHGVACYAARRAG